MIHGENKNQTAVNGGGAEAQPAQNVHDAVAAFMCKNTDMPSPQWAGTENLSAQVPVAASVTNSDQQPTQKWLLAVSKVGLEVAMNNESPPPKDITKTKEYQGLLHLEQQLNLAIYQCRQKNPSDKIGAEPVIPVKKDAAAVDTGSLFAQIMDTVSKFKSKLLENVGASEKTQPEPKLDGSEGTTLKEYEDIFRTIPLPSVAENFKTDETFALYRIAGPNPMSLRAVTKHELIGMIGCKLSDERYCDILQTPGDSLERAGIEGRLCVVNYKALSSMDPVVIEGKEFVTDPIAIFAEPLSGVDYIKPIAIQMGQDPLNSEIVYANTDDTWRWQMAKTTVQTADCIYHEGVVHLAHTHLVMEAFSVATQQTLSKDHPIRKLLSPHIEGTNFINNAAAASLINFGGPIDSVFCNDRDSRLRGIQAAAATARLSFDFTNNAPDVELKLRGVDKLKVFPYRDDILLIWEAIKDWTKNYVDLYYDIDKDVLEDAELNRWSLELQVNGSLINFESPRTKKALAFTLAMIMHLSAAQHAAVNFPQQPYMTFVPTMTGAVWDELPDRDNGFSTEAQWLKLIPPINEAVEQLGITYLLGGVYYGRLGLYASNEFPYNGTLDSKAADALAEFQSGLDAIEVIIKQRNKNRGHFVYPFLLPSKIPASINI